MTSHDCIQEETLGAVKEFIGNTKGLTTAVFSLFAGIIFTIILQIGFFLVLWGGLNEVVKKNTEQVWEWLTPLQMENTRNIDKILERLK